MFKIEIYTKNKCVFCDRAKIFFKSKKLSYSEYNIDKDPNHLEIMLKKTNGIKMIPQIFIDDFHIGGFDNLIKISNNGQLNKMINK